MTGATSRLLARSGRPLARVSLNSSLRRSLHCRVLLGSVACLTEQLPQEEKSCLPSLPVAKTFLPGCHKALSWAMERPTARPRYLLFAHLIMDAAERHKFAKWLLLLSPPPSLPPSLRPPPRHIAAAAAAEDVFHSIVLRRIIPHSSLGRGTAHNSKFAAAPPFNRMPGHTDLDLKWGADEMPNENMHAGMAHHDFWSTSIMLGLQFTRDARFERPTCRETDNVKKFSGAPLLTPAL